VLLRRCGKLGLEHVVYTRDSPAPEHREIT
jgi:hypothetical protein